MMMQQEMMAEKANGFWIELDPLPEAHRRFSLGGSGSSPSGFDRVRWRRIKAETHSAFHVRHLEVFLAVLSNPGEDRMSC
jgi:hypothetical protein